MTQPTAGYRHHTSAARHCLIGMAAALAVLSLGCYSPPKAFRTFEFLDRYDRMTERYDPLLSLAYVAPDAKLSDYSIFVVGNVAVGEHWVEDPATAQRYVLLFRMLLAEALMRRHRFSYVVLDPRFQHRTPMMRMEAKVTIFDTGSGLCRFLTPFYFFLHKAGATDFQIEGRIYDTATGRILMEFADRRRFIGNTPWGPNPATFKTDFVMKHTMMETTEGLAEFIDRACEGVLPDANDEAAPEETKPDASPEEGS